MVTAKTIMSPNVITVARDEDIYRAIRTMVLNNVTGLPVVNKDGTVAGILTEKDVLDLLYQIKDRPGKAEDYMTSPIFFCIILLVLVGKEFARTERGGLHSFSY